MTGAFQRINPGDSHLARARTLKSPGQRPQALTKHAIKVIIDPIMTTHSPARRTQRRDTALALGVGLFLFAVYLLSYRGGFHSVDEVSMFAVTESLVKFGRLNTDQIAWTQWATSQREAQGFFGVDGHVYSKKGLAMSLAMAPLYWLGLVTPGLGMLQTASLLNPILTAITAGLLFRLVRRLGYDERVSIGVALLYGLATIAWVYSKYLFSEPLSGALLLATAYLLVAFRREGDNWRVALAGLLAGLAVATRANNLFLVPIFGLYLVAGSREQRAGGKQQTADQRPATDDSRQTTAGTGISQPPTPWFSTPYSLLPAACFLLGLVPPALLLMGYNWVRAGNPLQTGYDLSIFSPNLLPGLYKLLFSPLRGLFIYSPLLVLSLPGLAWLWRRGRAETALVVGVSGVTVLLFSAWTSGEGLSWGSRFLVPVVPLLCLPLAPPLDRALAGAKVLAGSLLAFGILSFAIQLLGVAINPWVYLGQLQANLGGEFFLENTPALTDFRYTQIIGQLRSWALTNSDVLWWQPWGFDGLSLGAMVVLVGLSGTWLWCSLRQENTPRSLLFGPYLLTILAALTSLFVLGRAYRSDRQFGPPNDGYTRALATVAAQAGPGETIISVAPYHYHVPMNRFKARVPIVGFAQALPPLTPSAESLLQKATTGGTKTWFVVAGLPPADPANGVELWLAGHTFKAGDEWYGDDFRLAVYGTTPPDVDLPVGARLGDGIALSHVRTRPVAHPGEVLPLRLTWRTLAPPTGDYVVFAQLLDSGGNLVAQRDERPLAGYRPTHTWGAGQTIDDRAGLLLPTDLSPGDYRLIVGMYDPGTGERLSLSTGGDFVDLGTVTIR